MSLQGAIGTIDVVYNPEAFQATQKMGTRNESSEDTLFRDQFNISGTPVAWNATPLTWRNSSREIEICPMIRTVRFQIPYDLASNDAFILNFPKHGAKGGGFHSFEVTTGAISNAVLRSFLEPSEVERALNADPREFYVQLSAPSELLSTENVASKLTSLCIQVVSNTLDTRIPLNKLQVEPQPNQQTDEPSWCNIL